MDAATVIAIVISAGGGAFILAILQGLRDVRQGARVAQRETVEDLRQWLVRVEQARAGCELDRDFWRDLAAERGHQLRQAGILPANPIPLPPTQRVDLTRRTRQTEEGERDHDPLDS